MYPKAKAPLRYGVAKWKLPILAKQLTTSGKNRPFPRPASLKVLNASSHCAPETNALIIEL